MFPFRLGRQTLACPASVGVSLIKADVANRRGRIDRCAPRQTHHGPIAILATPVQRRGPVLSLDRRPAVRQPQVGTRIAAILNEGDPVAVRHQIRSQSERLQPDTVCRTLIVEREARLVMADRHQTGVERHRSAAHDLKRLGSGLDLIGGGVERRARHQVQHIHQEKLLMLLVVVQTQLEQIALMAAGLALRQPGDHAAVDLASISQDLVDGRPGHQPTLVPPDPLAQGLIVGVEQLLKPRIDRLVFRIGRQDHRLEKPAGVRQMPFAGAAIRHRLGRQILGRQTFSQIDHA